MPYVVKLYKKTGFNAVNVPDTPALLETAETLTMPSVDTICDWGLSQIVVQAAESDIVDVDYCKVGSYYYAVGMPEPLAADTWRLPLTYDGLTTRGGPAALTYLDGITERHTVGDDAMFAYTQDDEYMVPQEALQVTSPVMYYGGVATEANTSVVIESTIDLTALAAEFSEDGALNELKGLTFTDPADSANEVTVPYVKNVVGQTTYTIGTDENAPVVKAPNTRQYMASFDAITKAIGLVRSLGVESAIISQVVYPDRFVTITSPDDDPHVQRVTGLEQSLRAGSLFDYYADAQNKRLAYGQFNKYCLVTAAGDRGEFLPEQIGEAGDEAPYIKMKADPRPTGGPYFRFAKYMGSESESGFWINALRGLPWANAPLVYQGASGSYQTRQIFNNNSQIEYNTYQEAIRTGYTGMASTQGAQTQLNGLLADAVYGVATGVKGYIDSVKAMFSSGRDVYIPSYITAAQQEYGSKYAGDVGNRRYLDDQYSLAREQELQQYGFSQSIVAPQVSFPFSADAVRDFEGNGVYFYRYHYSDNDAKRIDKLLTMYGYKDTVPITADLFSKRQNFDYVRAHAVSVGGDIPMWERAQIAQQLNAGVRVWHVKPDPGYYTNNPISASTEETIT